MVRIERESTHARIRALTHDACTHTHDHARTHAHAHTLTRRKHADAHTCMCTRFGTGNHRRAGGPKVNEGRHKLSVKPFETNGNTQCRLGCCHLVFFSLSLSLLRELFSRPIINMFTDRLRPKARGRHSGLVLVGAFASYCPLGHKITRELQ